MRATPPDAPADLVLVLHGTPRVVFPGGREVALERRAAGLCALVALEANIARERAAALLWPDSDDPRRNLRQQLLRFRKQFGRDLVGGEAGLTLAPGVALAEADGELLSDQPEADDDFGLWLAERRAARATLRRGAWQRELADAEQQGDLDRAQRIADAAVAADPTSEDTWHALMRTRFLRGEPTQGLAAYDQLERMLAARHGRAPSTASVELADALRRGLRPAASSGSLVSLATSLPVTLQRPPQLAGRSAELTAARRAWAHGQAALLEGEAGLGKSRLIAELVTEVRDHALLGAGRPGDAGAPYATLARWLAPLLAGGVPQALAGPHHEALAHVVSLASAPKPEQGPREALGRSSLASAVQGLLALRGISHMVLDDLHFADAATLELTAAMAAPPESPTRWLFATRPAEATPPVQALRDDLAEQQRLQVVRLAPLGEAATADLVDALGVVGLSGQLLAPALVRHTGGNPLFLLETLKQGLHDGSLARGELPRPLAVSTLIERRLQRLSESALTLARVAAIAGVDFGIELAEEAIGVRAVRLASAWDELQLAQVLRGEAFAHDLVADAVLHTVPQPVARRMHESVARWLQARGGEPARRAEHWAAAGFPAEAGTAWLDAAARARTASRHGEELGLLIRAADAFALARDHANEFDAVRLAATAVVYVDAGDAARAIGDRLLALAHDDLRRAQALAELAFLAHCRYDLVASESHGREAAALAVRLGRPDIAFAADRMVAVAMASGSRPAEALALMDSHRDWVLAHGTDENRGEYHCDRSWPLSKLGRLAEARDDLVKALQIAEDSQRLGDVNSALLLLATCESRMGDAMSATAHLERALAQHDRLGNESGAPEVQWAKLGALSRDAGNYARALQALEHGARAPGPDGMVDNATGSVLMGRAQTYLDLGRPELAQRALPKFNPPWDATVRANWHLRHGRLKQALGQDPGTHFDDGLAALGDSIGGDNLRASLIVDQALAARDAGAFERVAALAAKAQAQQEFGLCVIAMVAAAVLSRQRDAAMQYAARVQELLQAYVPFGVSPAWVWLHLAETYERHGEALPAAEAWSRGAAWVRQAASAGVPEAFRRSFVERNPVHRRLLSAMSRLV